MAKVPGSNKKPEADERLARYLEEVRTRKTAIDRCYNHAGRCTCTSVDEMLGRVGLKSHHREALVQ